MNFWLFYGIVGVVSLLTVSGVVSNIPNILQKPGPLYEALQLLIANEKLTAQMIWNKTQGEIDANANILQKVLDYLHNYEDIIDSKLRNLNELGNLTELEQCHKQYERQIARFNRDLITKYRVCRHALNSSLSQLEEEIRNEIDYIRDAPIQIQELMYDCNVTALRQSDGERSASVRTTMCITTQLGAIKQRTLEAMQICWNIIGRVVVSDMDQSDSDDLDESVITNGDNVCLEFRHLKNEFQTIHDRIVSCIKVVKN